MLFHVFNSQEERRAYGGSAFIEIQFCKLSTKRKVTERVALRSIQHWQNDSLYVYVDDEDMIEINYADGMLIDVGKPMATNQYCITVVSSNDALGWKNPIQEITVANKEDLFQKIQETVFKFRQL